MTSLIRPDGHPNRVREILVFSIAAEEEMRHMHWLLGRSTWIIMVGAGLLFLKFRGYQRLHGRELLNCSSHANEMFLRESTTIWLQKQEQYYYIFNYYMYEGPNTNVFVLVLFLFLECLDLLYLVIVVCREKMISTPLSAWSPYTCYRDACRQIYEIHS